MFALLRVADSSRTLRQVCYGPGADDSTIVSGSARAGEYALLET